MEERDWIKIFTLTGLRKAQRSVRSLADFQSLYNFTLRAFPHDVLDDLCRKIMGHSSHQYTLEVFSIIRALALKWRLRGKVDPAIVLKYVSM